MTCKVVKANHLQSHECSAKPFVRRRFGYFLRMRRTAVLIGPMARAQQSARAILGDTWADRSGNDRCRYLGRLREQQIRHPGSE